MARRFWMAAVMLAGTASADVTVRRVTVSDGMGGGFTAESTDRLQGTNRRSDTAAKFAGAVMNKMAGGSRSQIVRVADDQVLDLDHGRKTCRAMSISEMGKKMAELTGQGRPAGKPSHRVLKSSVKVTPTGEKRVVNGFACERVTLAMTMEVQDVETGETSEMKLLSDNCNAAETPALKALREAETAYGKAFAKKMGLDLSMEEGRQWGLGMGAMLGIPEDQMKDRVAEMRKEFAKMKGFPVSTEIAWYGRREGAAAPRRAAPRAEPSAGEGMPDLSGGAGGLAAGLAGRMMKKKMEAAAAKSEARAEARASGQEPVFKSRTEIKEVTAGAVDPALFLPPAGYKEAR